MSDLFRGRDDGLILALTRSVFYLLGDEFEPNWGRGMNKPHSVFGSLQVFSLGSGGHGHFYSLPALEKAGVGPISRLPVCVRIVLESVLRNFDGKKVSEQDIRTLANWKATAERTAEIPFIVARIVLQDFTGVPLLVDLAAMRS